MDKICGYGALSQKSSDSEVSSSSDDETQMKNEDRVIQTDQPTVKVFTGTEKSTERAFRRVEQKEERLEKAIKRPAKFIEFVQHEVSDSESVSSQTISQDSDVDKKASKQPEQFLFLKKNEEIAYLNAITDTQAVACEEEKFDKLAIEKRENVSISMEMI